MYDSTEDVKTHIHRVGIRLYTFINLLQERALIHDASKLQEPEKSMYDKCMPKIREVEQEFGYGSPQYEQCVKELYEVGRHHFAANSHHPEHYPNGINGMSLIDLIEALADWKAASERSGQVLNIEANKHRFNMSDQLYEIFQNTIKELGW